MRQQSSFEFLLLLVGVVVLSLTVGSSLVEEAYYLASFLESSLSGGSSPSVKIIHPASGSSFTLPASVGVSWEVNDPDNDVNVLTLDCGNGTTVSLPPSATSYTCTYDSMGTFTINLVVVDSENHSDRDSVTINIAVPPTYLHIYSPSEESTLQVGEVRISWTYQAYNVESIEVDCGNGSTASLPAGTYSYTCSYTSPARYTVNVTLNTSYGSFGDSVSFYVVDEDSNEQACVLAGHQWCPDCLWSDDGKMYRQRIWPDYLSWEFEEEKNCVGDDYPTAVVKYFRTIYAADLSKRYTTNPIIVELNDVNVSMAPGDACMRVYKGRYGWAPICTPIPTIEGRYYCEGTNVWKLDDPDVNRELCDRCYGGWCPDCLWSDDGKIYARKYYGDQLMLPDGTEAFEDANCLNDPEIMSTLVYGRRKVSYAELNILNLETGVVENVHNVKVATPTSGKYRYGCLSWEDGKYVWEAIGSQQEVGRYPDSKVFECSSFNVWRRIR